MSHAAGSALASGSGNPAVRVNTTGIAQNLARFQGAGYGRMYFCPLCRVGMGRAEAADYLGPSCCRSGRGAAFLPFLSPFGRIRQRRDG